MAEDMRWWLKPVEKEVAYDPHLEHHELAEKVGRPDPAIRSGGSVDIIARLLESTETPGKLKDIPVGIKEARQIAGTDIVTGRIALTDIETVRPGLRSLKAATELYLDLFHSLPEIHCDQASIERSFASMGLDGSGVVIGVVDVGCDFAHESFLRDSGKTRLLALWDQSDPPPGRTKNPPAGFHYGREFTQEQIDKALAQKGQSPYDALGYTPGFAAHGTHVLDIAAGNGRGRNLPGGRPLPGEDESTARPAPQGVAPEADLVFVHLRTNENEFLGNSRLLLEAVEYIFQKAGDRPAVVNLSLSTTGGPHDGTTLVEQGLQRLLETSGRAIVVSAGNSFHRGVHAQGTVKGETWEELKWTVDPRGAKNEMEIWYRGASPLTVLLIPPDMDDVPRMELGPIRPGKTYAIHLGGDVWGRISHRPDDPNNGAHQIDIRLSAPPAPPGKELKVSGTWTIRLQTVAGAEVPFDAWIEQDDQAEGRFETLVSNACTLGSISCAEKLLTVGAFDTSRYADLQRPYDFTAAGPTRNMDFLRKPDIVAPGVDVLAARARGGTAVMSGTSMAAPHLTGLVALLFQLAEGKGHGLLPIETTRELIIESTREASGKKPWDPRLGWGRINGVAALTRLDRMPPPSPALQSVAPEDLNAVVRELRDQIGKLQKLLKTQQSRSVAPVAAKSNGANGDRPESQGVELAGGGPTPPTPPAAS